MQSGKSDEPEPSQMGSDALGQPPDPLTEADVIRLETQGSTNAISRVLAIVILMCLPGFAGLYLDNWLGTQFFVGIGFVIGMAMAIAGLLYVSSIADKSAKEARELRNKIKHAKKKEDQP